MESPGGNGSGWNPTPGRTVRLRSGAGASPSIHAHGRRGRPPGRPAVSDRGTASPSPAMRDAGRSAFTTAHSCLRKPDAREAELAPGTAAAEQEADRLLCGQPGVYTARQLRDKARRETPISALSGDGDRALDAEDWLTLHRLGAMPRRFRLRILYDRLDDSERRALIRWMDGATQAEIGAVLGVSQRHVSTILARAVLKCRDSCALYEGSSLEGEFWWLVRETEKSIYRPPERVWRHQRTPDRALARSLGDKGQTFLFFVNLLSP